MDATMNVTPRLTQRLTPRAISTRRFLYCGDASADSQIDSG
jgi:hypothetical protein